MVERLENSILAAKLVSTAVADGQTQGPVKIDLEQAITLALAQKHTRPLSVQT